MTGQMATGFLGGARDRLLPWTVPFRFFLAAAVFHVAAWAVLAWGADQLAGFTGGPGPVLAALHLTTLGVLAMTAMGASYQLLPVVTRRPMARIRPATASFWLMLPGTAVLSWGMALADTRAMEAGGWLAAAGLVLFAALTLRNLARAGSVPVVAAHGWAALGALAVLVGLGLALIRDFSAGFLADHGRLAELHMAVAVFGFMGLLVLGFSLVLVPMFALARTLPPGPGWAQLALGAGALATFALAVLVDAARWLWWPALAAGLGAAVLHVLLMRRAERGGMRRRLGLPFLLIRSGRASLLAALLLAGAARAGLPLPGAPALIGFLLVAGWLLGTLTGVLQRILPFLASMHGSGTSGRPLLMSELTLDWPLRLHVLLHFAALALVAGGILLDSTPAIRLGALAGAAGALAFLLFAAHVAHRLHAAQTPPRKAGDTPAAPSGRRS